MHRTLPFLFSIFLTACGLKEKNLHGQWKAIAFYENGKTLPAPLDSVLLRLDDQGGFVFQTQGFYRESGPYRHSARYLFLTDTTVSPSKEHVLKVLFLSPDTLKIRMSREKKEQVLFFTKQK